MSIASSREARDRSGPYRICVVCLGNICRSPIAEVVLGDRIRRAGLAAEVVVDSAGTGGWHVGEDMDPRSRRVLLESGYQPGPHRGRRFDPAWLDELDLVLAMDRQNLESLRRLAGRGPRLGARTRPEPAAGPATEPATEVGRERLALFGSFGEVGEVPDPYTGGPEGFGHVLAMVESAADALVHQSLVPALATRR